MEQQGESSEMQTGRVNLELIAVPSHAGTHEELCSTSP